MVLATVDEGRHNEFWVRFDL